MGETGDSVMQYLATKQRSLNSQKWMASHSLHAKQLIPSSPTSLSGCHIASQWFPSNYPLVNKHGYGKWPFVVDFPIKNCDFSAAILNYQRVRFISAIECRDAQADCPPRPLLHVLSLCLGPTERSQA